MIGRRGKQDDGDVACYRVGPQSLAYGQPVHVGHVIVQQHKIRLFIARKF